MGGEVEEALQRVDVGAGAHSLGGQLAHALDLFDCGFLDSGRHAGLVGVQLEELVVRVPWRLEE